MKRCLECGYSSNKDSTVKCEKCGTPLNSNVIERPIRDLTEEPAGKKTVKGAVPNMPYWDDNGTSSVAEVLCVKCSYPLLSIEQPCPNCGFNNNNNNTSLEKSQFPAKKGTAKISDFSFPSSNTKIQLVNERDGRYIEFEGEEIVLNRDVLDKNNNSISSAVHARLQKTNGSWSISDESSNKATFIQITEKTLITDGTLVLIGNKFYRFKIVE